jgi:DNA-binding CsgD family transcriptional regulator
MERKHVCIVGPRRAQNELMASFIAERIGIHCTVLESLGELPAASRRIDAEKKLVLKDCPCADSQIVRDELEGVISSVRADVLALFNVAAGRGIEIESLRWGVKGFFYEADGTEVLVRGITALFEGNLWISRKALTECLLNGLAGGRDVQCPEPNLLTTREAEVLAKVAAGVSNEVIAGQLCISPYTVKTHVYRIFRKIGASNRLQASLWAAQNLS